MILTVICDLPGVFQIVPIEGFKLTGKRNIAGADFSLLVHDNRLNGQCIVLNQLISNRIREKFRYSRSDRF